MTSYAVFGGAGFIGRHVCNYLSEKSLGEIHVFDDLSMGNQLIDAEYEFNLTVGDMRNSQLVEMFLKSAKPDVILHLVANSDILASSLNPKVDVENTLLTTVALTKALQGVRTPLLIFASSSAIFGDVSGAISNHTPARPQSPYGYMKLASELLLEHVVEDGLVERLVLVRFPNVTGRWQTHGVVRDLVKKLFLDSDKLEVLGDGTQSKPYAAADQLVENIFKLLPRCPMGTTKALIAPQDKVTVKEIVKMLIDLSGRSPRIEFGASRAGWVGDVPEYSFDCTETESLMGEMVFDPSKVAIKKSLEWELENWNR